MKVSSCGKTFLPRFSWFPPHVTKRSSNGGSSAAGSVYRFVVGIRIASFSMDIPCRACPVEPRASSMDLVGQEFKRNPPALKTALETRLKTRHKPRTSPPSPDRATRFLPKSRSSGKISKPLLRFFPSSLFRLRFQCGSLISHFGGEPRNVDAPKRPGRESRAPEAMKYGRYVGFWVGACGSIIVIGGAGANGGSHLTTVR